MYIFSGFCPRSSNKLPSVIHGGAMEIGHHCPLQLKRGLGEAPSANVLAVGGPHVARVRLVDDKKVCKAKINKYTISKSKKNTHKRNI
jgi:hypothetical protein